MKIAIIGAGLSGVYLAYRLQKGHEVTLYEGRERFGGRVHTIDGMDMGPSWIWGHHRRMLTLLEGLGLRWFAQYDKGEALYETPQNVSRFHPQAMAPSGRIEGGVTALIEGLRERLEGVEIHLGMEVTSLEQHTDGRIAVHGDGMVYDRVISTLPPRVAAEFLQCHPPLTPQQLETLGEIPTWMGHSAKCVITFESAFWREQGLSGFGMSHRGPLGEIHDACTAEYPALFGFVASTASMGTIEADVTAQLIRMFGEQAAHPLRFECIDWREERYSATAADAAPRGMHPQYGLRLSHFEGRLLFSGTETALEEGGYLEGALVSAEQTLARLGD